MTGIEWVYLAAVVASASIGAYSSYQSGKQQEEAALYQAKVATMNQRSLSQQADFEATNIRSKYRRARGAQRAAAAKSGLTLDGSISDVMLETNVQEDLDVMSVLYRGKQAALGEEMKKNLLISQGRNARTQGNLNAVGSIIGGVASGVGSWPSVSDTGSTPSGTPSLN